MSGKGGYQRPRNPAPASGPGAFSRRTDGGPGETATQAARYISGEPYGQGQEINALAHAAPLAAGSQPSQGPMPISLDAPTQRPDEPMTAGVDAGEGPGSEVLPGPNEYAPDDNMDVVAATIRNAYAAHPSPALRIMVQQLEADGR